MAAGQALDVQPLRGRPISGGRRELTTVYPYLIRYRVKATGVEILEVRHGARAPA
jgi:toxin ParE1/3/4